MTSDSGRSGPTGLMVGVFAAAVLLAGGSNVLAGREATSQPRKSPRLLTAGRIQRRTYDFKEAGKKMEYALYVPKAYDRATKWPLVVALHGLGSTPQQIMRYPGMTRQAQKHGYIVVAPMGYSTRGWYGSLGKTSRRMRPKNLGELSEKDVLNVLALTRKEFNIDEDRIYLLGHSMGGGGTWHLGIKYPTIWAALAPIAPAIYRSPDALVKIKHIPVILVQGEKDRLVPVATARRWAAKMEALKMVHTYIEVPGGGHVLIAFANLPKIFEFFNRHRRKANPKTLRQNPGPSTRSAVRVRSTVTNASRAHGTPPRGGGAAGGGADAPEHIPPFVLPLIAAAWSLRHVPRRNARWTLGTEE